jgi:NAD+ kinase
MKQLKELKKVAIVTRDQEQNYPIQGIDRLFERMGIEIIEANAQGITPDIVIALGGDGTVLRALVAYPHSPVLAVNYGRVGFLTQCDREGFEKVLICLLSDQYFIEERLALEINFKNQKYRCINECVIKGFEHMISVEAKINGHLAYTSRGDGIIVGTPTGSTAYLMSTGAPLVMPNVNCLIINPLNEYRFGSRAMIAPGEAEIKISVSEAYQNDMAMVIDGSNKIPVNINEEIIITKSEQPARLIIINQDYFFRNLRDRLGW